MIMETNDDFTFERKSKMDEANMKVQEWEQLMWNYQQAIPGSKQGEKWRLMDRIFCPKSLKGLLSKDILKYSNIQYSMFNGAPCLVLKIKYQLSLGGGSGIGKAIALLFAKQESEVHILDIDENAKAVVEEINTSGGRSFFINAM